MPRQGKQVNFQNQLRQRQSGPKISNIADIPESNIDDKKTQRKRKELIDRINALPNEEVVAACHLFETMTYTDGKRKGKILSPYLINKAKAFIVEGL